MNKYEEALDTVRCSSVDTCRGCIGDCYKCDYSNALDILENVIGEYPELKERATPKKPNKNTDWYECPNCLADLFPLDITNEEIREIETVISGQYSNSVLRYCPICGQALDWSD